MSNIDNILNKPSGFQGHQLYQLGGLASNTDRDNKLTIDTAKDSKATSRDVLLAALTSTYNTMLSHTKDKNAAGDSKLQEAIAFIKDPSSRQPQDMLDLLKEIHTNLQTAKRSNTSISDSDDANAQPTPDNIFQHYQTVYSREMAKLLSAVSATVEEDTPPPPSPSIFVTNAKFLENFMPHYLHGSADQHLVLEMAKSLINPIMAFHIEEYEEGKLEPQEKPLSFEENQKLEAITGHNQDEIGAIMKHAADQHRASFKNRSDKLFTSSYIMEHASNVVAELISEIDPRGKSKG